MKKRYFVIGALIIFLFAWASFSKMDRESTQKVLEDNIEVISALESLKDYYLEDTVNVKEDEILLNDDVVSKVVTLYTEPSNDHWLVNSSYEVTGLDDKAHHKQINYHLSQSNDKIYQDDQCTLCLNKYEDKNVLVGQYQLDEVVIYIQSILNPDNNVSNIEEQVKILKEVLN